jgi:hypothetical protein
MTVYEVKPHLDYSITEREADRITKSFVFFACGRREGLATEYSHFFVSIDDAVNFCKCRVTRKIQVTRENLSKLEDRLLELETL